MTPPGARKHLAGLVASPVGTTAEVNCSQGGQEQQIEWGCKRRSKNPSLKRPVGPVAPE
jgi:hypothetical protein